MLASGPALDAAWAAFRAGEGLNEDLAVVSVPNEAGRPIPIRFRTAGAGSATPEEEVTYDAVGGTRLAAHHGADMSLGQRIVADMLEVHSCRFFGWPVALLFCAAALGMPVLTFIGITLYGLRRTAAALRAMRGTRGVPS